MATDLEKQLVAFYGDDLVGILQRLSTGSNRAVEEVVQNIFSRLTIDAEIFGANITKEVARLQANGVSRTVIAQTIKNDMQTGGRIFGQYRNSIKGGIVEQVNQSGRLGQLQSFPPEQQLWQWTTVGGHKICADCEGRAGEVLTWEEWEREGLPGSGWSVCRGHCYCVLVPAGKLPRRVDGTAQAVGAVSNPASNAVTSAVIRTRSATEGLEMTEKFIKSGAVTSDETLAMKSYFANNYSDINDVLSYRAQGLTDLQIANKMNIPQESFGILSKVVDNVDSYLAKAPRYEGSVQRGVAVNAKWAPKGESPSAWFASRFKVGEVFTNNRNWSTAYKKNNANAHFLENSTLFNIKQKNGVLADGLEAFEEAEVLIRSGTKFRVISKEYDGFQTVITLEEL